MSSSSSSSTGRASDMVWLSSVYDPASVNFVNQQVPRELAALLQAQKIVPLRKSEIADDPSHAHCTKAASQLTDEASVWTMVAWFLRVHAAADGHDDFPQLQHSDYEILSGKI